MVLLFTVILCAHAKLLSVVTMNDLKSTIADQPAVSHKALILLLHLVH